jgi:putative membrane protein
MSQQGDRLLVLAVDRDGDLESKTRVRSPVYGRETILSAATQLAISDPEEADANALFAAVKQYDQLRAQGVECEVASVCGLSDGGLNADRKIRREVETLLNRERYSGIVLISDGGEDEQIIPILQSLKPIVSVVRIVVKHSRTVEESYLILGRYLRMLVFDPRYSRWAIGVPGLIFLFAGVLVLIGRAYEAGLAILLILGGTFFVRGFNLDRSVASMLGQRPYGYLRLFSGLASILILLVGFSSGFAYLYSQIPATVAAVGNSPGLFLNFGGIIVGYYLRGSLSLLWAGFGVYFAGALLAHLARGSARVWRDGVMIVILGLLYLPMDQFTTFLMGGTRSSPILLVSYVLVGLAVIFGVVTTVYRHARSRPPLLKD